jgi:hypothetical protein
MVNRGEGAKRAAKDRGRGTEGGWRPDRRPSDRVYTWLTRCICYLICRVHGGVHGALPRVLLDFPATS